MTIHGFTFYRIDHRDLVRKSKLFYFYGGYKQIHFGVFNLIYNLELN